MANEITSVYAPSKTILVDFDGTLCPFSWPEIPGEPFPEAVETVNNWHDQGYRIVLFTARAWKGWDALNDSREEGIQQVVDWSKKYGLKYDEISNEKRPAIMIIDDSAAYCGGADFWVKVLWRADDGSLTSTAEFALGLHQKGNHMNLKASRDLEEKQNAKA